MAKNIEVTLKLDSKQFNRGMAQAKGSMKGVSSQAGATGGSLMGLAARFAPLAAAVAAAAVAFKGLGAAVGAARTIEDVGVVLRNIVGDAEGGAIALQRLRDVAQELPYDFEQIAGASPALATISKDINELEANTRLAADIAATTGLTFEEAASQLQRAFSGGAGAADMFREKGVLSMAKFEAGATYSIEETQKKLKEFGKTIEGNAKDLNNTFSGALSQTKDRLFDFAGAMGAAILPEFMTFFKSLVAVYDENKESIQAFAKVVGEGVVQAFYAFLQTGAVVVDFLKMLYGYFQSVAKFIQDNFGGVITTVMDIAVRAIGVVVEAVARLGQAFGKLTSIITGDDTMENFFGGIADAARNLTVDGIGGVKIALEDLGDVIPNTGAQDWVADFIASMDAAGVTADEKAAALAEKVKNAQDAGKRLIANGAGELASSLSDYASAGERLLKTFGDATNKLSSDLADALMTGKDAMGSFRDFFSTLVKQIITDAIKLMVIQPILTALFGGFGYNLAFASAGTTLSKKPAGTRAQGGRVMKNQPYIVGESGREAFIPGQNGQIVPNNQLGGSTTNVTYNIQAVDPQSFQSMIARDKQFIHAVVSKAANDLPSGRRF
tara:strand:+ start:2048 stop:3880 length:1833 start_codon:yes stop_codon:yes gene_type:complete